MSHELNYSLWMLSINKIKLEAIDSANMGVFIQIIGRNLRDFVKVYFSW